MSRYNEFEQWKSNPDTYRSHMCLCTCYACYHLCELNFKRAVPLAMMKHQLYAMELKAKGAYEEPCWDGFLNHRGQNAPKRPEGFSPLYDEKIWNVQQTYVYTQPYGATKLIHEGEPFHCRCNCNCEKCMTLCVEVPVKEAAAKRKREEDVARLQAQFEADLRQAAEEADTLTDGVTQETALRVALGSLCYFHPSSPLYIQVNSPPPSPVAPVLAEPVLAEPVLAEPEPKPRPISPELNWPYVRCKAVFRALMPSVRQRKCAWHNMANHLWLLNWLSSYFGLPLEKFKATSLYQLAKEKKYRFSQEARTSLLSTYPPRSDVGRNLRVAFKIPMGQYGYYT